MPATNTAALLTIQGLCKSFFGVQVLHDVGLELWPGKVLGLVGENGSGKSTTMNILGGVHQPDRGSMAIDGQAYAPRGPRDAEARGIVAMLDAAIYHTAHNERGRAEYHIVRA